VFSRLRTTAPGAWFYIKGVRIDYNRLNQANLTLTCIRIKFYLPGWFGLLKDSSLRICDTYARSIHVIIIILSSPLNLNFFNLN
jgi:hypothetical protein